jgi:hypothetical protein
METTTENLVVRTYRKLKDLTPEEKEEHRRSQLRSSQLRYREKNGLIKPKETDEDKLATRKEKARERYLKKKSESPEVKEEPKVPLTYTVDYKRQYHRDYYEKNKAKLLARSKEFAMKKKQQVD